MSQIRKSASFRSRIPIRRAKPVPRRCYSPEPYRNLSTPAMYDQSHNNDYDTKPMCNHGNNEQRISKQKMKRQRHIAATTTMLAQQHAQQHSANKTGNDASITSVTNFPAPIRPKTIYSSSSYSSSDESQESEAPPQVHTYYILFINERIEFKIQIYIYCYQLECSLVHRHKTFSAMPGDSMLCKTVFHYIDLLQFIVEMKYTEIEINGG